MKKRQKTTRSKTSIPKESKITDKEPVVEHEVFSVHSVSSLEASSISSSASHISMEEMEDEPTTVSIDNYDKHKDNSYNTAEETERWLENSSIWEPIERKESVQNTVENENNNNNREEGQGTVPTRTSPSECVNARKNSTETRGESAIHHKLIQKKRNNQTLAKKANRNWSIWKTIVGWFGKQTQEERIDA